MISTRMLEGPFELEVQVTMRATVKALQNIGILRVEDGNHGEYRPRPQEFVDSGVAFIRAADLGNGKVDFESASKINPTARQRITKGIGAPGDVLISHKGTVGKVGFVPEDAPEFVCSPQTTFWRTVDTERLDRGYLFTLLRSPEFQAQFRVRAGETDMAPYVSLTSQRDLILELPDINVQRYIAQIIGSLDDKIELNRRMSQTLEEIARALFKSWFVDFDPVHAKAAGRQPVGMDAETAALFPSEFEDSELGSIPKGWKVTPLDQIATFLNGLALQKFPVVGDESLPAIKIAQIKRGSTEGADRVGTNVPEAYIVHDGDMLFSWSGSLELVVWHGGTGALNQHLFKVTPKDLPDWLVYFWIDRHLQVFREIAADKATTMGHIQRRHLTEALTVLPSAPVLCHADRVLSAMFKRANDADAESGTLAELRDLLLPRLISGELVSSHQGASSS